MTVAYNKRSTEDPILRKLNLELNQEKAVIVGPNGSGKSTLFKAILGLAPISGGAVKLFGIDAMSERQDTRVSTNLAEVYRIAYVRVRDLVSIFAELTGDSRDVQRF